MRPAPRRTPSGTLFIDGQADVASFAVVTEGIRAAIPTASSRKRPAVLQRGEPAPVLLSCLAHHLGRTTVVEPDLMRDRLRAFLVGWEIEELTDQLAEELGCADVLLGISDFNTAVFRRHFPHTPAITVPVCPPFPSRPAPQRERWNIPSDAIVFLNVFNPASGFDRKNPIDVYDAFLLAFGDREDVRMVFKVHGGFDKQPDEGDLTGEERRAADFLGRCASDSRVILIDEFMPYDDVVALVASCDVYVSLARAEGLGLPVLEAMALGVPTMCLDYSGHTSFVSPESNLLVAYDLIDIPDDASHYYNPRNYSVAPRWAQPRVEDAAALMQRVADDHELRDRVGRAGREAALDYQRACAQSTWVAGLESAFADPAVRARHAAVEREFQRVAGRDRSEWVEHYQRLNRARRVLAVRTRLGRVKWALARLIGRSRPEDV